MLNEKLLKINKIKMIMKNNFVFICKNKRTQHIKKKIIKNSNLSINKVNSRIFKITLQNSIINNLSMVLITGSIKILKFLEKSILIKSKISTFNNLFLTFKFNSKMYFFTILKKNYSINYFQSKKLLTQICMLSLKKCLK